MRQLNNVFRLLSTTKQVLRLNDSLAVSLLSGLLGTLVMDVSNLLLWRIRKTEAL